MTPARRASKQFGGTPADALVVGLGNPGRDYVGSRHNVGFEVIDELSRRFGCELREQRRQRARVGECRNDRFVVLVQPQTYMNLSGEAGAALLRPSCIQALTRPGLAHDAPGPPAGRLRVKSGGGLAGHNGLRSLRDHLGTTDFARIRIGVGKPPDKARGADHVLRRVGRGERELLDQVVDVAADAVACLLAEGVDAAMNAYNGTDLAAVDP